MPIFYLGYDRGSDGSTPGAQIGVPDSVLVSYPSCIEEYARPNGHADPAGASDEVGTLDTSGHKPV